MFPLQTVFLTNARQILPALHQRYVCICRIKPPGYSMLMSFGSSLLIRIPLRWTGISTGKRFPLGAKTSLPTLRRGGRRWESRQW
jgi:hypothetical protein